MGTWIDATALSTRLGSERYNGLLDDDNDGSADAALVAQVIARAEGEFNSYVGTRYDLAALATSAGSDATLAALITGKVLDLAEWFSENHRPVDVPDTVRKLYEDVLRWLRDVADGRVSLAAAAELTETNRVEGHVSGAARVFTRDKMDGL